MRCRYAAGLPRAGALTVLLMAVGCATGGVTAEAPAPTLLHPQVATFDCTHGPSEAEQSPRVTELADNSLQVRLWLMHEGRTIPADSVHASIIEGVLRIDYDVAYPDHEPGAPIDLCAVFSRLDVRFDALPRRPARIEVFSALAPSLPQVVIERGTDEWPATIPQ